jgi:hypothetical protein
MTGPDLNEWARRLHGDPGKLPDGAPCVHAPGLGHSAADRSLAIIPNDRDPDGFSLHSFADDDLAAARVDVKRRLGSAAPEPARKPNARRRNGHDDDPIIAKYAYENADGSPNLRVCRTRGKKFFQQHQDRPGCWINGGITEAAKVPFKLPEIIEAIGKGQTIYIVEGEKAALALIERGFAATCSPGGAGKWPKHFAQWLADADVVILPDFDAPGRMHADKVRENLDGVAASVRIINLPGLRPGEDVFDWLQRGGDPATISDLPDDLADAADAKSAPPNGAATLGALYDFVGRFIVYPDDHSQYAHVAWIAHAHLMERWDSTPRLAALSPEPASGKTRLLEVTELLVPRPVLAVEFSPAYLFRKISDEAGLPTILHDEVDAVFAGRAPQHEELRALYNSGHRRGAVVGRVSPQGKKFVLEEYPAFCPVALAGLGDLPETLMSRSLILRMRRRAPGEVVEPFRRRLVEAEAEQLRDELADWAASLPSLQWPDMPSGVEDRGADCWEPLIAVADAAGGEWPARIRAAAVTFVTRSGDERQSLGVRLLGDLREVFGDADQMFTEDILAALNRLDEAPWGDLRGKPLDARALAGRLRNYGIRSGTVRVGLKTAKGYVREALHDAWARYVPTTPGNSVTSVTSDTGGAP